jgi:phosphoribosylanthranilate isomerase
VTIWVKICGLTTREAVEAAVAAGADAVGFVFAPSKRQVSATQAAQLALGVPRRIPRVAVMLHPTQNQLDEVWSAFRPDVLQTDMEDLATLRLPMGMAVMPVMRHAVGV